MDQSVVDTAVAANMSKSIVADNNLPTVTDSKAEESVVTDNPPPTVTDGEMGLSQDEKQRSTQDHFKLHEVLVLTSALLIIIVLFITVPTTLFAVPENDEAQMENPVTTNSSSASACSPASVEVYTGKVCRDAFTFLQICFSGVTSPPPALNIPSLAMVDQETREMDAVVLFTRLSFLNPSQECMEAVVPFFCISIFGLCDVSSTSHTILRGNCLDLRDNLCASQWSQAAQLLGPGVLPVCEDLPDISDDCVAPLNTTSDDEATSGGNMANRSSDNMQLMLDCSDGFFFNENGTGFCVPECGEFNPRFQAVVIFEQISVWAGVVASVVLLILAFTIQRKSLLVFPSIFVVYICIAAIVRGVVFIVEIFCNTALFCGSKNFITAIAKESTTGFCTFTGIVFVYSVWQICIWMLLFAVILFWGVRYPFSFRQLKVLGSRIHYIHIFCVALAVLIPVFGVLLTLRDGYSISVDSPYICIGRDREYNYYSFILPLGIILAVTAFLLVFTFWTIIQESVLEKKTGYVMKGELKITILIAYTMILAVLGTASSVYLRHNPGFRDEFLGYILCEAMGIMSDCDLDTSVQDIASTLLAVSRMMLNFMPVVILLISFDLKYFKKKAHASSQSKAHLNFSDAQYKL